MQRRTPPSNGRAWWEREGSDEEFEFATAVGIAAVARGCGRDFCVSRVSQAAAAGCWDAGVFCAAWIAGIFRLCVGNSGAFWRRDADFRAVRAGSGIAAGG